MDGLPKLPGLDFDSKLKMRHHLPHSLGYRNGYRTSNKPPCGIGGVPLKEDSVAFVDEADSIMFDPLLTYGRVKHPPVPPFRPHYVVYDKKVLKFNGFFKQCCADSPNEYYRIRYVNILYFLEDDSITVIETPTEGKIGRLVKRGKLVKNEKGQYYTWKDLNVGIDIELQGIVFHTTDCDEYTHEFLLSNGIELNEKECLPADPMYTQKLISKPKITRVTPQVDDKLRKYLEFTGKVLHFDCVLDETDRHGGELMTYKLFYFLEDDTIAIKELKENRTGRDHFPMLLKRTKLPKTWTRKPVDFPDVVFERSNKEVVEFYQPKDLEIGGTVFAYGRRFLLLDCDKFTRKYYDEVLRKPQGNKRQIQLPEHPHPQSKIPTYLGLGTPEDSLTSCFGLHPKPPKKDVVTYLVNANKYLRYELEMDSAHPEDKLRRFILFLSLADGSIKIKEKNIENSGIKGGTFLSSRKVPRHGCNPDKPDYMGPKDFYIGKIIHIFAHRFKVIGADLFVYRYMQTHSEQFTSEIIETVKAYHMLQGNLKNDFKDASIDDCNEYRRQLQFEEENRKHPTFMEKCLEDRNIFPDINKITMEEEVDTTRKRDYSGNRDECPYPIIPADTVRKDYHSNMADHQTFFVDPCKEAEHLIEDNVRQESSYPNEPAYQQKCPTSCEFYDGFNEGNC